MILTKKQIKALAILNISDGLTASKFAVRYFDEPRHAYLFTAMSNQGNGACAGKKAWLCAGSFLAKLKKDGYAYVNLNEDGPGRYRITALGKLFLKACEKKGVCSICGCTENNACTNPKHGNCWWVNEEQTVCSHCACPDIANDPMTIHPKTK